MRVGDLLVEMGLLSASRLSSLREEAAGHQTEEDRLVAEGLVTPAHIAQARGTLFDVPWVESIPPGWLDAALVADLPLDWARSRVVLPVRAEEGRLAYLCEDPGRFEDAQELGLLLGDVPAPVVAPASVIQEAIEACYFERKDSTQDWYRHMETAPSEPREKSREDDLLRSDPEAPVSRTVNMILLEALKAGASDVHLEPFAQRLRLRYRVDGLLLDQADPPKQLEAALVSRLKVMGHLDIAERRLPQDGTARVRVGEREIDIRISTVPVAEGERLVLRLLNRQETLLPLTDLGMEPALLGPVRDLLAEPYGVIWVTGPTGSGKTTTLYAALQELDPAHQNIMTIEDPIEYQLPDIGQIGVKPKIGLTFSRGLRHILRQDPDVILVGETRDLETAEIVVRASLTGHLVFSTLHTNDAAGALVRLVDMGIAPYLVASSTRACLAQRLLRRLCPVCRQEGGLTAHQEERLGPELTHVLRAGPLYTAGRGCSSCREGFRGRVGIYELFPVDASIGDALRNGAGVSELREYARARGMRSLLDSGVSKVRAGITSLDEVLRVVGSHRIAG